MPKLSSVTELIMGQSPPSNTYNDKGNGLPFYQGKTDFGFKYPVPRLYCTSPQKTAEAGDILISVRAPVGPTNIASEKSCIGRGLAAIRAQGIDSEFLLFNLRYIESYISSFGTGSTFTAINKHHLANLEVNPSDFAIDEQRRIAHVLSTVQTAIEQQARLIALTQELKRALMRKLFTEGLCGEKQKMTEIGPVPEGWEIKHFDEFSTLQRGKDLTKSEFKNGRVPVAGSNGIIGYHDTAFVKTPGVTVGRSGSVGKVTFYEQDFWAHNTSLYVKDFHGNDPRFSAYYLEVLDLTRFKTGASVPTLDRNSFKQIPIAVPPKDEQIEIGNILATTDKKIQIVNLRKAKLEELFRTLLHQLMTGQVRVKDVEL